MLEKPGFKHVAYDWRGEHVPTFAQEWGSLEQHGVVFDALWALPPGFPQSLDQFQNQGLRPSLWVMVNAPDGLDQAAKVKHAADGLRPHLEFLNLNGMTAGGDKKGRKIMVLGQGDPDVELARVICESGYSSPIGILNHTDHDADVT